MEATKLSSVRVRQIENVLLGLGYDLEDNSIETDGRLTMSHGDNATRRFLKACCSEFASIGFGRTGVFSFSDTSGDILEIEPGGPDASGHLIHWMING